MRITHYLRIFRAMLVLTALLVPGKLGAQNVTMDARNVSVQEAVTILQSQGNYTIVINADDVDLQKRVSVSAKDAPLSEVLSQIFAGQNLDFAVTGNTVSVTRSKPAYQNATSKTVFRGVVVDRNGEALIGASIVDTMKVQAEEMRRARFNIAERKAARAPSIMILPIAVFIMPAIFIVIGIPVLLKISSSGLGGLMK